MQRYSHLIPQGMGLDNARLAELPTVSLDWDVRQKSRFSATDDAGRQHAAFLPHGSVVRGGDVLIGDGDAMVRVLAAAQPLLRITCEHGDDPAFALTRAAYHLGNRHVPIELRPDRLMIEPDHVLAQMLQTMGLTVVAVEDAFEPEAGAYGGHGHGHAH